MHTCYTRSKRRWCRAVEIWVEGFSIPAHKIIIFCPTAGAQFHGRESLVESHDTTVIASRTTANSNCFHFKNVSWHSLSWITWLAPFSLRTLSASVRSTAVTFFETIQIKECVCPWFLVECGEIRRQRREKKVARTDEITRANTVDDVTDRDQCSRAFVSFRILFPLFFAFPTFER